MKPYSFPPPPPSSPTSARPQQGYVTSDPCRSRSRRGFKPNAILLADYGFDTYSTTIETRRDLVEQKPDLVQRFVDASIEGWATYLYGDASKGNAAIKARQPRHHRRAHRLLDGQNEANTASSTAATRSPSGIGAMTAARFQGFYATHGEGGVVKPGLDISRAYTLAVREQGRRAGAEAQAVSHSSREPAPALVSLRGVGKTFPAPRGGDGVCAGFVLHRARGRVRLAARPLGLRQDDGPAADRGAGDAR